MLLFNKGKAALMYFEEGAYKRLLPNCKSEVSKEIAKTLLKYDFVECLDVAKEEKKVVKKKASKKKKVEEVEMKKED